MWEKINPWACLEISGLKLIFNWKCHVVILVKSLFKSFDALLILCTIVKIEVSSVNSFGLRWRPSDKSETNWGQEYIFMGHRQKHHLRKCFGHVELLFISVILRTLLKFSKESHRSHFFLDFEWDLYAKPCQMSLKYLKTHYVFHTLELKIDKYQALLTKAD